MHPTQGDDDQESQPSTFPGTVIAGKYRIEGLIGRGGMGSVWSAMHLTLGQRVAVKLIAKRYVTSREARQRFELEAKAAAQLRSRYVVQVYDSGETAEGTPYIAMELLDGESLDHRIQRGPIPLDQTLRILGHVGRALTRAHGLGIVHRDLKPENIFLTRGEDDDGETAKVLDFGIAKIKTPEGSDSATRTGTVLGTPLFMSPEQARGLKSVDHRTDIYSLGMVAYMMLTGQPAFSGESFGDLLVAICTQPLPSIERAAPTLPRGLDAWLGKACAREPGDRYATIEQLVEGLQVAAGLRLPSTQSRELVRSDSAGDGQIPPRTATTGTGTQVASAADQRTTGPLTVSGDDIPKRSMLGPILLVTAVLAVGAGAFVFLRKSDGSGSPASADSPAVLQAFSALPPSAAAQASAAPSTIPQAAPLASAQTSEPQKVAPLPRPSDKKTGDAPRGIVKAPPPRPSTKPPTDLGF